jgi:hypothetical protein
MEHKVLLGVESVGVSEGMLYPLRAPGLQFTRNVCFVLS